MKCVGVKPDGSRCGLVTNVGRYCWRHDPNRKKQRSEAVRAGRLGRKNRPQGTPSKRAANGTGARPSRRRSIGQLSAGTEFAGALARLIREMIQDRTSPGTVSLEQPGGKGPFKLDMGAEECCNLEAAGEIEVQIHGKVQDGQMAGAQAT